MVQETLDLRVAQLEKQMNLLLRERANGNQPTADDWKQTIGMFRGDPIVEEMIEQSRRMREEDRRRANETTEPGPA